MRAIITLTSAAGKRLIARAVARMPELARARERGKILLKAGTTVSAVAEELAGVPLRIAGRITPRGLKGPQVLCDAPHSILIEGSGWRCVDGDLSEVVARLRREDVVIIGANVIDAHGGAALMRGTAFEGNPGHIITGAPAEGVPVIVVAGLEKLIPGTVQQAVRATGRKSTDRAMGMAVGLMPICGKVVTEVEAVRLLAQVDCQVIGKGGIQGAEGGVVLVVSGETPEVERILRLALELRDATISGVPESLVECEGASRRCSHHLACVYRSPGKE